MQGNTTTTGTYPQNKVSQSISCITNNLRYPFFKLDSSINNTIKINILFNNKKLTSISLTSTMNYTDSKKAKVESDSHHWDMNESFRNATLGPDALSARYMANETEIQMSLYAASDDLNESTYKYFLLDSSSNNYDEYIKKYTNQNFNCIDNNEKENK